MDVLLSLLNPDVKRQLWTGIQKLEPGRADMMANLKDDPMAKMLDETFGAKLALSQADFNKFMKAGASNNA